MKVIELIQSPNQSLSVTINGVLWSIGIKAAVNTMAADITRDGVELARGQRIVADYPIIPYRYLSGAGNFAIITQDGALPWWEEFGETQTLVYLEPSELGIND